jgi:hypothetical protein
MTVLAFHNHELNRLLRALPSAANLQQNFSYRLLSNRPDEGDHCRDRRRRARCDHSAGK